MSKSGYEIRLEIINAAIALIAANPKYYGTGCSAEKVIKVAKEIKQFVDDRGDHATK